MPDLNPKIPGGKDTCAEQLSADILAAWAGAAFHDYIAK
jgi:hypothetical protein